MVSDEKSWEMAYEREFLSPLNGESSWAISLWNGAHFKMSLSGCADYAHPSNQDLPAACPACGSLLQMQNLYVAILHQVIEVEGELPVRSNLH